MSLLWEQSRILGQASDCIDFALKHRTPGVSALEDSEVELGESLINLMILGSKIALKFVPGAFFSLNYHVILNYTDPTGQVRVKGVLQVKSPSGGKLFYNQREFYCAAYRLQTAYKHNGFFLFILFYFLVL